METSHMAMVTFISSCLHLQSAFYCLSDPHTPGSNSIYFCFRIFSPHVCSFFESSSSSFLPVAVADAFGASIIFYCIFYPFPEESNAGFDAREAILLKKKIKMSSRYIYVTIIGVWRLNLREVGGLLGTKNHRV